MWPEFTHMVFTYSNLGVLPLRLSLVGLGLWLLCPSHWPDPSPPDEPSIFIFSSVRRLHLLFSNLHFCSEAASLMGSCQECSYIYTSQKLKLFHLWPSYQCRLKSRPICFDIYWCCCVPFHQSWWEVGFIIACTFSVSCIPSSHILSCLNS